MDEFSRHCLLNGLDDIGLTLQHEVGDCGVRGETSGDGGDGEPATIA